MLLISVDMATEAVHAREKRLVDRRALFAVTERLLHIYQTGDAAGVYGFLAPPLQAKYTVEMLATILTRCRELAGTIERVSPPVSGTRSFGYSAVYTNGSAYDMTLEVDNDEKVLFWMISSDVTAQNQRCKVHQLE